MLPFTPPLRRYQPGLSRSERYSHVWHTAGTQDMPAEQTYLWPSKPGRCHVLKASLCSPPLRPLTSTQPFKVHLGCHHAISPAVPLASLWGSDVSPAENTVGWWGIVEVTLSSGLGVLASSPPPSRACLGTLAGHFPFLSPILLPPEGADWTSPSPSSLLASTVYDSLSHSPAQLCPTPDTVPQ